MYKIEEHPILDIPKAEEIEFKFNQEIVKAKKGYTIAAALHQAGFPVHSHSLKNRNRSLECGIGKCGACEMLVDGEIKRICIQKVDDVNEVRERAGVDPWSGLTQDNFRDAILDERGRELFGEGTRRQDLIRHGVFIDYALDRGITDAEPHEVLFPIPQSVIIESNGVVVQNEGYQ